MAFITRYLKKLCQLKLRVGHARGCAQVWRWLVVLGLLGVPFTYAQTTVELSSLKTERQDNAVVLSGKWQFELSAAIQDALLKGIAMHFVAEADIIRERWYFYDKRIAHAERHYRLSYLPLTQRWRLNMANQPISVSGLGVSLGQTFDNLDEAIAAVQRLSQWRVAATTEVDADVTYQLEVKFRLDLTQLPRPLQIGAAGQSEWNLTYSKRMPLVVEPAR